MRIRRGVVAGVVAAVMAVLLVGLVAGPAGAGVGPRGRGEHNRRIAIGGTSVAADETVDGPLISVDGRATVAGSVDGSAIVVRGDLVVNAGGTIDGDVFVLRGDARINGRVDGNVVALSGRAVLGATAVVTGDVTSTETPLVERGARVRGDVKEFNLGQILRSIGIGLLVFWWVAVTISTAILGAIMLALIPRGLESTVAAGRERNGWWRALLIGLALVIGLPIVAVIAISSLVGLPLGLGLLGALGLLHAVGYVTGAFFLGRAILRSPKNRFGAFFIGWGILRVLAVLPGLGVLVWLGTAVYGVGMLAIVAFQAGRMPRAQPALPDPGTPGPGATEPAEPAGPEPVSSGEPG